MWRRARLLGRREWLLGFAALMNSACRGRQHGNAGLAQQPGDEVPGLSWEGIAKLALGALTEAERQHAAVYLDARVLAESAPADVGRRTVRVPWPAVLVFVDREPQANWSHSCRYLLVHRFTGEIESIESEWPPFLQEVPKTLRLVWKGPAVPEWAVIVREPLG